MPPKAAAKAPVETPAPAHKDNSMNVYKHHLEMKGEYMKHSKWHTWESPIGLSIFLLSLCLCLVVLAYAFGLLRTVGLF
ncbi:MAG: hypothetical protein ACK4NC_01640 [Candidatus Gracilibacteria bacterium]